MRRDLLTAPSRNIKAGGLVAASVLLISIFPVFVAFSKSESPFLFACTWQSGVILGLVAFLAARYPDVIRSGAVWLRVWQRIPSVGVAIWIAAVFDIALFAWSADLVDVSISAVLFATRPLGLVLLTAWLFSSEGRYRKVGPLTALALLAAVAGVALVALSHQGDMNMTRLGKYAANAPVPLAGGVGLALGAAVLGSLNAIGFRWGADLAKDLPHAGRHDAPSIEVFSVLVGYVVCTIFAAPGLALIGFARDEPVVLDTLWLALIGGSIIGAGNTILWRWGILLTSDLKILVVSYFTPLLSLLWLYSLSLRWLSALGPVVGDVHAGYLMAGAMTIVGANVGLYFEAGNQGRQQRGTSGERV